MIRQLTGIRAVLAWWVVLLHVLSNPKISGFVPFSGAFSRGYLAVDGFFILSGFILCYVYEEKFSVFSAGTYRTYLVARLARIYPIHLLMLAAFAPIAIANRWLHLPNSVTSFSLPDLGLNLLLVQAWGLIDHPSWNGVAWSISAEWFVYLLLPLFLWVVVRGESALHLVKLFVIVIVCILVLHWVKGVQDDQGIKGIYSTALARVSANFALGCVAFVLSPRIRNLVWLGTLAAAGAATCATFHLDEGFSLCFMLLIIGLSYDRDWLCPILSGRVMVYLGETSFALYMVHVFVWEAVAAIATKLHLLRMPGVFVVIPVALLIAFIASAVVFRFVEVPAREFIRGHGTRRGKVVITHS